MPSLNDLKLTDKPLGYEVADFADIPAERASYTPPPQPGAYRFRFPPAITNWDTFPIEGGEALAVIFDADTPLTIIQSKGGHHDGEAYSTRINTVPLNRGRKGERIMASDWDLILKAKGVALPPPKKRTLRDYAKAIVTLGSVDFGADLEFSYKCDARRAARFYNEKGELDTADDPDSPLTGDNAGLKPGCGSKYYQSAVPKVDGQQPLEITCTVCGASVRAFSNLRNFRP